MDKVNNNFVLTTINAAILPFCFMLHNMEEIIAFCYNRELLPNFISLPQFIIAASLFTLTGFIIIFVNRFYKNSQHYIYVISSFAGLLLLNVFVPHLLLAIYNKEYNAGLITALFFNLPISCYLLRQIHINKLLSKRQLVWSVIVGGIAGLVLLYVFMAVGEFVSELIK